MGETIIDDLTEQEKELKPTDEERKNHISQKNND